MPVTLKVMTFNLRIRVIADGKNYFDNRRDKIRETIARENPDLIGFQEANDFMADWLDQTLTDYTVIGHGRGEDGTGEGMYIAYRRDRFRLRAFHGEALSLLPKAPGSRLESTDQSSCPRTFACAELICKDHGERFAFYNIHTDHKGASARLLECAFLMRDVSACDLPFVITGDFNDYPNTPPIELVMSTAESLGTVDATCNITGTFHGFKGDVGTHKIDYIFTNMQVDPNETYAVPDDDSTGCYYSDHNALCAFVTI